MRNWNDSKEGCKECDKVVTSCAGSKEPWPLRGHKQKYSVVLMTSGKLAFLFIRLAHFILIKLDYR